MRPDDCIPKSGGPHPEFDHLVLKDRALDEAAEGITIADATQPDRPLIYVNKGFEQLTGYSANDVLGRNCRFLQGEDTDPVTVATIRNAVEAGRECVVEILNYHKNGQPFWNRLSITPVKNESGVVTHFIGIQSDVTARKNAELKLNEVNAKLDEANRRIKEDLEMAAQIQRGFLPPDNLRIPGLEFVWKLRSCEELAGDTLNVVPIGDRRIEVYAIDVSGHGAPAALLSVTLNHLLSPTGGRLVLGPAATDDEMVSPVEIARTLNRHFPHESERNQYFTMAYGVYDKRDRVFRFISAGHPPVIHVADDGRIRHDWAEGLPIGVVSDPDYGENTVRLARGDRIYMYSDGLLDAEDSSQQPYGLERLVKKLDKTRPQSLRDSVEGVIEDVESWGQTTAFEDDVSILAFEVQ
jgi:PAS domain S-box-containing protein